MEVDFVEVRLEVETTLGLEALVTLGEGLSAGRVGVESQGRQKSQAFIIAEFNFRSGVCLELKGL